MSTKENDDGNFCLDDDLIESSMEDIEENSELYDSFAGESTKSREREWGRS